MMADFLESLCWLRADKRALTALEYGLIAAIIASVMVVGFNTLGTSLSSRFSAIATMV